MVKTACAACTTCPASTWRAVIKPAAPALSSVKDRFSLALASALWAASRLPCATFDAWSAAVVLSPCGEALCEQRLLPLEGGRGLGQLRLRSVEIGLRRAPVGFLFLRIDAGKHGTPIDVLADIDKPFGDAAADTERQIVQRARGDHAGERGPRRIVGHRHCLGAHHDRQLLVGRLLLLAAGQKQRQHCKNENGASGRE